MKLANTYYINRTKLAEELGITVATLPNWAKKSGFPNSLPHSGKTHIYNTSEVISGLEKLGGK